jgi:peptidyl-prolyl cis-trans isomerase C
LTVRFRLVVSSAIALAAAAGCAEKDDPAAPLLVERAEYSSEAKGRLVVAEVNGEPVYDDCVVTQAEAKGIDKTAALQECIDFELLAQAAREAGMLEQSEVLEVRKREAVRAMIDQEFVAAFASPAKLPVEDVKRLYQSTIGCYVHRPERATTYCRVPVNEAAERGGAEDAAAKKTIDAFYGELRAKRGITKEAYLAKCAGIGGGSESYTTRDDGPAVIEYATAAFSIKEPGMVAEPVRTRWGWDVILLDELLPARNTSFEEAEAELRDKLFNEQAFEKYRRSLFDRWAMGYSQSANVLVDKAAVEKLGADAIEKLGLRDKQ